MMIVAWIMPILYFVGRGVCRSGSKRRRKRGGFLRRGGKGGGRSGPAE